MLIVYFAICFIFILVSIVSSNNVTINKSTYLFKDILFVIVNLILLLSIINKNPKLKTVEKEEQQLSTLINSMVDFVCFKDGEGRWLKTNSFGLELFQLKNVDYKGKTDTELAEYSEFYRNALIYCQNYSDRIAWESKTITRCEEVIPLPGGGTKTFDTIKHPLFHEDGSRKGLVVIGRDITEKKFAEERLLRSEKLSVIGELAASVAHEIRNPLTSLKGFVQLMRPAGKGNDRYHEIMLSELERIDDIVGELLLLAKPQKVKLSKIEVSNTIEHVISLLENQANLINVKINFYNRQPSIINCEVNQIKQLLINIIKNAIEASGNGGTVEVILEENCEGMTVIQVIDTGEGIPDEAINRLGEPFFSSKEKGTGLGLTVSFKIIEQHGGKISYKSEPNKGTIATILLPSFTTQKENGVLSS
jgi:PAS domain S-box-containing protein